MNKDVDDAISSLAEDDGSLLKQKKGCVRHRVIPEEKERLEVVC